MMSSTVRTRQKFDLLHNYDVMLVLLKRSKLDGNKALVTTFPQRYLETLLYNLFQFANLCSKICIVM